MKGFYFEFARLAIRLLMAIYRNQVFGTIDTRATRDLEIDVDAWLEKYK